MGPLAFSLAGLFPLFFGPFALSFAFAFRPGRTASQYCRQAGGPLLRQEPSQGGWLSLHHLDLQYSLPPSCAALLHPLPACSAALGSSSFASASPPTATCQIWATAIASQSRSTLLGSRILVWCQPQAPRFCCLKYRLQPKPWVKK